MAIIATVLLAFAALTAVANWCALIEAVRTRRSTSLICLVGGIASFAGCALHPAIDWRAGLLAPFVDPGCSGFLFVLLR